MQAVLPEGRGDGLIAVFQAEQVQGNAAAGAGEAVYFQGKFRGDAVVGALGLAEVAEMDQFDPEKGLRVIADSTPAGVGDDNVWAVALGL